jgi:mono/diheme cytochrome c family protein
MNVIGTLVTALMLSCVATAAQSASSSVPDPAVGRSFAQRTCGYCHMVTEDQGFAPLVSKFRDQQPQGPNFSAIAANPRNTEERLRTFLMTTHKSVGKDEGMPNPLLANHQIDNIVSFIISLREDP